MCELNLVKNMATKLEKLVVFELDSDTTDAHQVLQSLMRAQNNKLLLIMSVDSTDTIVTDKEEHVDKKTSHRLPGLQTEPQIPGPTNLPLTLREQEILALIAGGMTNKMIARELDICDGTVKVHVKNLMRKLKVRSRLEAAVWALALDSEQETHGSHKNERI